MAMSPGRATEAASAAVPIWLPALQKVEHLPGAWGSWRSTPAGNKLRDCPYGTRYEGSMFLRVCSIFEGQDLLSLHHSKRPYLVGPAASYVCTGCSLFAAFQLGYAACYILLLQMHIGRQCDTSQGL